MKPSVTSPGKARCRPGYFGKDEVDVALFSLQKPPKSSYQLNLWLASLCDAASVEAFNAIEFARAAIQTTAPLCAPASSSLGRPFPQRLQENRRRLDWRPVLPFPLNRHRLALIVITL